MDEPEPDVNPKGEKITATPVLSLGIPPTTTAVEVNNTSAHRMDGKAASGGSFVEPEPLSPEIPAPDQIFNVR